MSRLQARLAEYRGQRRKVLTTFITAGDPSPAVTVPALRALVAGGADVLELGVPFSDPEAEGPAIQASSERALAAHTTLTRVLELVAEFRRKDEQTPVVLMGYLNSVLRMGLANFAERASAAGVDGLIMVNLPPEEAAGLQAELKPRGIDLIFLVAPTTTPERAQYIASEASGFVYYVSLKGITGAGNLQVSSVAEGVSQLRQYTTLPIMVGFGIKDAAGARAVAEHADGVVVGSALVQTMARADLDTDAVCERLRAQVADIRSALDH